MPEHRVPAVDRALDVLGALEAARGPLSLREMTEALEIPKSTVYRILNSLETGGVVVRLEGGSYVLGPRLLRLAQAVGQGFDLVSLAKPLMDELARQQGVTVKLSVLDADTALVVAASIAPATFSVTTQVGSRFPLHAGAASKVLAAWMDARQLEKQLPARLERFTPATLTRRTDLMHALVTVRAQGHARDEEEHTAGVKAIAVPVFDASGACVAALSIPFVGRESLDQVAPVLKALQATCDRLGAALGAAPRPRTA